MASVGLPPVSSTMTAVSKAISASILSSAAYAPLRPGSLTAGRPTIAGAAPARAVPHWSTGMTGTVKTSNMSVSSSMRGM